jgi:hypothetical protein
MPHTLVPFNADEGQGSTQGGARGTHVYYRCLPTLNPKLGRARGTHVYYRCLPTLNPKLGRARGTHVYYRCLRFEP